MTTIQNSFCAGKGCWNETDEPGTLCWKCEELRDAMYDYD